MPDIFDGIAAANAEKPAVIQDGDVWTYSQMNDRANAFAHGLKALGVQPGERAVWCGPNDEKIVLWGHAARKCGLVSVPLSYRFTAEESNYLINDSDAVLVFCDPEWRDMLESLDTPKVRHVLDYTDAEKLIAEHPSDPVEGAGDALGASMIYTSGTTGQPKGALRTHTDPALVGAMITELGYTPDDVHVTTGPLYHSGPAAFAALTQILGGTVVILKRFDPQRWIELVDEQRVNTTFSAPTQLKRIVSLPAEVRERYDTSSLRCVIANAAPVPYALKQEWIDAFGEGHLFEVYGSTELGVDTILRPEDQLRKPGSCGKPYGNVQLRVIKEDGTEAEPGEPGVLWINSTGVFDEYYKSPDKTDETKLHDDPNWRTVGDMAYRDEEGYFYICDRRNDMIISGGMNIYPAEIEAVLHAHPAVMDAAVFGIPSDEWGESVHAVVQLKDGAAAGVKDLEDFCRERLAGYKAPRSFEFRDQLPRTDSGKLLKRVLREEHWKDRETRV